MEDIGLLSVLPPLLAIVLALLTRQYDRMPTAALAQIELPIDRWSDLDSEHIRGYAAACFRRGLSPRSIQRRLSAARTFFRYLLREKHVRQNPVQSVSAPKSAKRLPENLDADRMARRVMAVWTEETWKYRTKSTGRQFRPGMLSWNYWAGDGFIMAASADGRPRGQFLSNAICPSNGADIKGPTANANSVGKVLGGRTAEGTDGADWEGYRSNLPNGASHTITFNPTGGASTYT